MSHQQGRLIFRHDSTLQHLVLVLRYFLKDFPNNNTTNCHTIKVVKYGRNIAAGSLNLPSDWILLAEVKR